MSSNCGNMGNKPSVIEREIDFNQIIPTLVAGDAQPAFSIDLQIRGMHVRDAFEMCMVLFKKLCIKHYGNGTDNVDLTIWTEEHGKTINHYFHSIGMMFNMWVTDIDDPTLPEMETRRYDRIHLKRSTKLDELLFIMRINNTDKVYIINYDYLPRPVN